MKKNKLLRYLSDKVPGKFMKKMKITLLLCLLCVLQLNAAQLLSAQAKVTLDMQNVPLENLFIELKKQTGSVFVFGDSEVDKHQLVSVIAENKELKDVLNDLLPQIELGYKIMEDYVVVFKQSVKDEPQGIRLRGIVTDKDKQPLPGVTILIKGSTTGVITNEKGEYEIIIPNIKNIILSFSFIGMKTLEVKYSGQKDLNIVLENNVEEMDEVVVNGYFTRKKESFTGVSKTFSGEELRTISTGNVLNTLSVLDPSFTKITNNEMGSDPNTIPDFEIRGSSSLKSEYEGNPNMPTFIMDGFEVSAQKVFDLDPSRIRFITILKDAAATAIYGSRAANGVVVIETVVPKAGTLQLSYNGSVNFEVADLSDYDLMNAEEKLEYELRSGLYKPSSRPGWTDDNLNEYNQKLKLVKEGNDVNWLAIPVKELGVGHKHSITAEGGNNIFRYAFDLYYSNKAGVMKGSKRDNYGGGIRLQYNLKKLKFTNYTSFDHLKSVNSPYGQFSSYLYYNPYYNPYDGNGNVKRILYEYEYYDQGFTTKQMENELYNAVLPSKDQQTGNSFLNNFAIEYDIIPGLKLKANLSLSVDNGKTDIYKSYEHTDFIGAEKKGSYSQTNSNTFSYDINAILSYVKSFKKHLLNVGAVYNLRETQYDMSGMYVLGFPNANMDHVSMGAGFQEGSKPSGSYNVTRLIGIVGNISYTYDDRFLLDASVRSDGSSLYGSNKRWGTFWSVGIGYNIHNEEFMKKQNVINLLKIRASIGTTGGQNFDPYQSMSMYSYNDSRISNISYSSYIGAVLKAFGNKNLKWQRVEKRNIGLDFELLKSRITGSFNLYQDISKDVLVDVSIAPSLGFDSYKDNLGEVENSGIELSLKGTLINDYEQNIKWDVLFNLAHNKNKVTKINKALTAFNEQQDSKVKNKPTIRYQEGLSQNTIWVNESLGIDPATGEEIFLDKDNNKVNKWSAANYKPWGSTDPKIYGTIGTMFIWKNWELNAYLYYKYGGYLYNQTLVDKVENVNPNENGDKRILYDRWNKPGDIAKFKKVSDVSVTNPTSRFVEKENYIQLQSISLSYDFYGERLKKWGIQRLKLSAIGNDIFTSSTVKMERGTSYPYARTFSLAAQITF